MSENKRQVGNVVLQRKWHTCGEVAEMLGYGESKVRALVASGDMRSPQLPDPGSGSLPTRPAEGGGRASVAQRAAESVLVLRPG